MFVYNFLYKCHIFVANCAMKSPNIMRKAPKLTVVLSLYLLVKAAANGAQVARIDSDKEEISEILKFRVSGVASSQGCSLKAP